MAMRIVAEAARLMGAPRLIPIASTHIDGALYHGDSGTLFAEKLVEGGAKVAVRSSFECRCAGSGRLFSRQAESRTEGHGASA